MDVFFARVHPNITAPYILITHNSDSSAPGAHRARLDDPQLGVWYAQNCVCHLKHPKLFAVPIGIENRHWKSEGDFQYLMRRAGQPKPLSRRTHRLYVNLGATNARRKPLVESLSRLPFASVVRTRRSFQQYIDDISDSQFVASPFGNGIDCHRTWEVCILRTCVRINETGRPLDCVHMLTVETATQIAGDCFGRHSRCGKKQHCFCFPRPPCPSS